MLLNKELYTDEETKKKQQTKYLKHQSRTLLKKARQEKWNITEIRTIAQTWNLTHSLTLEEAEKTYLFELNYKKNWYVVHFQNDWELFHEKGEYNWENTQTERQLLNNIIEYLQKNRHPITVQGIFQNLNIDLGDERNHRVYTTLISGQHPKIIYDVNTATFSYQSTFRNVNNSQDLLDLINVNSLGLKVSDLSDVYKGVLGDIEQLVEQNIILRIHNPESNDDIVYPNFSHIPIHEIEEDIKELWSFVSVPFNIHDIHSKLQELGVISAEEAKEEMQKRLTSHKIVPKPKPGQNTNSRIKKRRRTQMTNIHLPLDEIPEELRMQSNRSSATKTKF